jgi:hypothetical protein
MPPRRFLGDRHKPSPSSKLAYGGLIGIGATAISLIAPTAAHAATETQWDRVAHCESGDNWHANTGNGYYGGLQFSASTWQSFDVNNYAARADEATREQQIDVANHVLARQGWSAWPVCSKNVGAAGTTDHDRAAHIRTAHLRAMAQKHAAVAQHAKTTHDSSPKTKKAAPASKATHHSVIVHRGDTLSSIARAHDIDGGWRTLYKDNRAVIGPDPSRLHVGMRLTY